jgi:hypothetical protein
MLHKVVYLSILHAVSDFPLEPWRCFALVLTGGLALELVEAIADFLLKNGDVCSCSGGLDFELVKAVADFHLRGWRYYFALVFAGSAHINL